MSCPWQQMRWRRTCPFQRTPIILFAQQFSGWSNLTWISKFMSHVLLTIEGIDTISICLTWTALGMTRAVFSFFISVTCKQQIDHYFTTYSQKIKLRGHWNSWFYFFIENPPPSTGLWPQSPTGRCWHKNRGSLWSRTIGRGPADNVDEVRLRICCSHTKMSFWRAQE